MSITRKGSRRIVVDGIAYRWTIRRKPTYTQGLAQSLLTFAVAHEASSGSILVVQLIHPRQDNWLNLPGATVTPAIVEKAIRRGLAGGWHAEEHGSPFELVAFDPAL